MQWRLFPPLFLLVCCSTGSAKRSHRKASPLRIVVLSQLQHVSSLWLQLCSVSPHAFSRSEKCQIFNRSVCFVYFQSSGDHPWPSVLWGHWHVVPGLCDSRALPGMAPLSGGLGVWSGNITRFLGRPNCAASIAMYRSSCVVMFMPTRLCVFRLHVCALVRVFGRVGCFSNPPDSPWWLLRSLPVYLNRCHRATCPISGAPVLQSKTLPRSRSLYQSD